MVDILVTKNFNIKGNGTSSSFVVDLLDAIFSSPLDTGLIFKINSVDATVSGLTVSSASLSGSEVTVSLTSNVDSINRACTLVLHISA